jgi:protoporphyrinogen oxidase
LSKTVIIGAGPAGLTAAWELARHGHDAVVFEQDDIVGGISRTCEYNGYRFDIGGHRFFTKVERVQELWIEMLDTEFLVRPRLSRIYYDGKFFHYPLKPMNALLGLGPIEAVRIGISYLWAQAFPASPEKSFEDWTVNRFGRRLFQIFFKTYTEKVWGMDCSEIAADFAAQRIKNLDLITAVRNALIGDLLSGGKIVTTLIEQFHYPAHGPGEMWESCTRGLAAKGIDTHLEQRVESIQWGEGRVKSVRVAGADGQTTESEGDHFLSSMPVRTLLHSMDPAPPKAILEAADKLRYRDYLTVVLILDQDEVFPDNWIYIHSPDVKLGRIQNYKNWSPEMVADPEKTALGLEYFVQEDDEVWSAADEDLIELGKRECAKLGLANPDDVVDGTVIRMPKAYPVYDEVYQDALADIRTWLEAEAPNMQLIGRNGQHRYNNQDHSMMTAVLAAENIVAGAPQHDVWDVNVEDEYHEEVQAGENTSVSGDRSTPGRVDDETIIELIEDAFARYDPVALGSAMGVIAGLGLFFATIVLVLQGGSVVGPNLSLLGNYLVGFQATWTGAFIGLAEAGVAGFGIGWLLAGLINFVIAAEEQRIVRGVEGQAVDLFEGSDR